jgi:hypothetical protein
MNWRAVGLLKRTKHDGADERERRAYRKCTQDIQPQGYVHAGPPSLLNIVKVYQSLRQSEAK